MKELYSEGRVAGLSTYELYVRQLLAQDPNAAVMSESQWLASTLSVNNSMILKIAAGTTAGYHDYVLPQGSDLCACTVVYASIFEGVVTIDPSISPYWAVKVQDYGRLISNISSSHPVTPGGPGNVPVKSNYMRRPDEFTRQCQEYLKIINGLVLQPGEWVDQMYFLPLTNQSDVDLLTQDGQQLLADMLDGLDRMSLNVDLSKQGFVRISFNANIEHDFYILLHGFAHKSALGGMDGFQAISTAPQNGDFLGPESFPWAVKVVFIYDNEVIKVLHGMN